METREEYEVDYQYEGNANVEGAFYEELAEARAAFEDECARADARRRKAVALRRVECDYEGDECVEVRELEAIEEATV